jgi:hypothetical protein
VGYGGEAFEQALNVSRKGEGFGHYNDIEYAAVQIERFSGLANEFGAWHTELRPGELGSGKVNARNAVGMDLRQKLPVPAADFQY